MEEAGHYNCIYYIYQYYKEKKTHWLEETDKLSRGGGGGSNKQTKCIVSREMETSPH